MKSIVVGGVKYLVGSVVVTKEKGTKKASMKLKLLANTSTACKPAWVNLWFVSLSAYFLSVGYEKAVIIDITYKMVPLDQIPDLNPNLVCPPHVVIRPVKTMDGNVSVTKDDN